MKFLLVLGASAALLLLGAGSAHAQGSAYVLNAVDTGAVAVPVGSTVTLQARANPEVVSRSRIETLFATYDTVVIDTSGGLAAGNGDILLGANIEIPAGKTLVLDAALNVTIENANVTGAGTLNSSPTGTNTLTDSTIASDFSAGGATLLTGPNTFGGAAVFNGSVNGAQTVTSTATSDLRFNGPVGDSAPLAAMSVAGSSSISGLVRTTGSQTYGGSIGLLSNVTLQSLTGSLTLNGTLDGAHQLVLDAFGTTSINGAIGSSTPIENLNFGGLGGLQVGADVSTTNGQIWSKPVLLTGDVDLSGAAADVVFTAVATIDGAFALSADSSSHVDFGNSVGATTPLTSLTVTGAGGTARFPTMIPTRTVTTTGAQSFERPVTSNSALTFTGTDVEFESSVTGPGFGAGPLQIDASGSTLLGGGASNFGSILTDAPGTTTLGNDLSAVDAVTLADDVVLTAAVDVNGQNFGVHFGGTVDGAFDLVAFSLASIRFDDSVGATTPLASLRGYGTATRISGPLVQVSNSYQADQGTELTGDVTMRHTAGGSLIFMQPINGHHALTLDALSATFAASVGATTALESLTTTSTTSTLVNAQTIRTTGNQSYGAFVQTARAATTFTSTAGGVDFLSQLSPNSFAVLVTIDAQTASSLSTVIPMGTAVISLVGEADVTMSGVSGASLITVSNGRFLANALTMLNGDVMVSDDGVVTGRVNTGSLATDGGTIDLDGSLITTPTHVHGDLTLDPDAAFISAYKMGGPEPFRVTGDVALNDATLEMSGPASLGPPLIAQVMISNGSMNPTIGTFDGLAEGDIFGYAGELMRISYVGGDGNDVTLTRMVYTSTTDLQSSITTGWEDNQATLTATVDGTGAGTPEGTVTFFDDGTSIGTAPLVNGVATFETDELGVGTHQFHAFYQGSPVYFSSTSSTLDVEITPTTPTTPIVEPDPVQPVVTPPVATPPPTVTPPAPKPVVLDIVKPFASASCLSTGSTKLQFAFSTTTAANVTYQLQRRTSGINNVLTRCPKGTSGATSGAKSFVTTRSLAKQYTKPGRYVVTLKQLLGKRPLIPGRYRVIVKATNPTTKKVDTATFAFVVLAPVED